MAQRLAFEALAQVAASGSAVGAHVGSTRQNGIDFAVLQKSIRPVTYSHRPSRGQLGCGPAPGSERVGLTRRSPRSMRRMASGCQFRQLRPTRSVLR